MKMIGIVDEFGIESFISFEGHYKEAISFIIRSKINIQRTALFFCLDFTDDEIDNIKRLASSREVKSFNEAGITILEKLNSIVGTDNANISKLLKRFYELRNRI